MHHRYLGDEKNKPKADSLDAAAPALGELWVAPTMMGSRQYWSTLSHQQVLDYLDRGLTGVSCVAADQVIKDAWPNNRAACLASLSKRHGSLFIDVCNGIARSWKYRLKGCANPGTKHVLASELEELIDSRSEDEAVIWYQDLNGAKAERLLGETFREFQSDHGGARMCYHYTPTIPVRAAKGKKCRRLKRGFGLVYAVRSAMLLQQLEALLQASAQSGFRVRTL